MGSLDPTYCCVETELLCHVLMFLLHQGVINADLTNFILNHCQPQLSMHECFWPNGIICHQPSDFPEIAGDFPY